MKFVNNLEIVKDNLLPVPPLFKTIQKTTNTPSKEMFEVFNMGHRMEIYTDKKTAEEIIFEIIGEINLDILMNKNEFLEVPINITIDDVHLKYLKDKHKIKHKNIIETCQRGSKTFE